MASTFISTQERTNFARMCWIVVDVFRDMLWHVLTEEISPFVLPNEVKTNLHKLKRLNKDIKSRLCSSNYASPNIPASKDFDVTSLYTLIRSLSKVVPTNGWDQQLPTLAKNKGDLVEWVRVFRNVVYAHAKEGHLNSTDYCDLCREMKAFVTSSEVYLGGNCDFVGRIDSILACSMDKALEDTYIDKMQEIRHLICLVGHMMIHSSDHLYESIDVTKQFDGLSKEESNIIDKREQKRIIDASQTILKQHQTHAKKYFVETQAYRNANEILRQHRRLILIGKSGQGKSYMAQQLLNKIITDDTNIKPLIISAIEQWKMLVDSSNTFGIIVDDMCGRFTLNEGDFTK
ncbi:hypothetical protein CHS0354_025592 [Potamilus streckersoni]|uniref:DZIP3-like HEPN domain-containing protein n=1 Tax=Potamilus streckersoni TaxID=2493646 RepID=A0AAE0S1F1_9BIVA|nr:hypothetical protein CHS0354_025592 [Potamilus streckersoni]